MESSRRNKRLSSRPGFHQANDSKSAVSDHTGVSSLCQRLGLTRSVRNKPWAPKARESAGGARGFAKHEGANTIFLTNKKLSLDKRLGVSEWRHQSNFIIFVDCSFWPCWHYFEDVKRHYYFTLYFTDFVLVNFLLLSIRPINNLSNDIIIIIQSLVGAPNCITNLLFLVDHWNNKFVIALQIYYFNGQQEVD